MRRIIKAPVGFETESEMKKFVAECERDFEVRLEAVCAEICSVEDARVITLSGPTCSGKTTAANKLISFFEEQGKRVHVISIDDFYYDKEVLHKIAEKNNGGEIDYDSAQTIDMEGLSEFVDKIFDGNELLCPVFDFRSGRRTSYRKIRGFESDIFLFEGIQAIYPEVRAILDSHGYLSAYISPRSALEVGGYTFEPNELRLLRRIVRDSHFRGTDAQFTLKLWDSVRANEEKNIFPYEDSCIYRIDSTFAYEIGVLAPYLREYLSLVKKEEKYMRQAEEILSRLEGIQKIPDQYLSANSLYREFV